MVLILMGGLFFAGAAARGTVFDQLEACEVKCSADCFALADELMDAVRNFRLACHGGGTDAKLDCLEAAKQAGFSADRATRTCASGRRGVGACILAAQKAGFSYDRNEKVCTHANLFTADCLAAAQAAGFSYDRNERVCLRARRDTANCINRTRAMGWGYDRIEQFCTGQ